jgi:hypothetical protein
VHLARLHPGGATWLKFIARWWRICQHNHFAAVLLGDSSTERTGLATASLVTDSAYIDVEDRYASCRCERHVIRHMSDTENDLFVMRTPWLLQKGTGK